MTYLCKALRHIWQEYLLAREFGTFLLDFLIPVKLRQQFIPPIPKISLYRYSSIRLFVHPLK